ncbi:MAG: tetratricopeptide repeat protein [Candidatus Hydrogenedens sp.]|jgi:tetratricopeptide (TPR) repeat protein|nr:tetratricopeptide repeat protein [Candidatus Hydrogenedens sp.]
MKFRTLYIASLFLCLAPLPLQAQEATRMNNEGVEAFNQGEYSRAITLLEEAHALDQSSEAIRRNLCNAYQKKAELLAGDREFNLAVQILRKATKVDPKNISPLVQMGSYYLSQDRVSDAIDALENAIAITPGNLNAHELLGQAYYEDNDLYSARVQWDYVLALEPDRAGLQKRYDKAFREESVEQEFNRWKANHFTISYPRECPARLRSAITSILERAYLDVGRALGGSYPPSPVQVVLYTFEQFSEATRMEGHVGAVYDGKIRSPLTDADGEWIAEEELKRRLVHEYVHVIVRQIVGDKIPWWLNEGLAETLSKSLNAREIEQLRSIYEGDVALSLAAMESTQMEQRGPDELRRAYLQAHATVDMLWNRYGRNKMLAFMRGLSRGDSPEEVFQSVYRRNYAACEAEVAARYLY